MKLFKSEVVAFSLVSVMILAGSDLAAQENGDEGEQTSPPVVPVSPVEPVFVPPFVPPAPPPGTPGGPPETIEEITDSIVASLEQASAFCGRLSENAYVVDCLAERLEQVAAAMPDSGEFAEARATIQATAAKLNRLARANRDFDLPRGRPRVGGEGPPTTSRALTPVDAASLARVNAEAVLILGEAQTLLLRSAESSQGRQIQYQRIAEALGSNKVLLRS
jgi:hypothetical protein